MEATNGVLPIVLAFDVVEDRLEPLTTDVPKPLLTVGNRALLVHQLLLLEQAGFPSAMVVTVAPIAARLRRVLAAASEDGTLHIVVIVEVVTAEADIDGTASTASAPSSSSAAAASAAAAPSTDGASASSAAAAPAVEKIVDVLDRTLGTADALRQVAARIPVGADLLVLPGDVLAGPPGLLHTLADRHRLRDAALTMLLRQDGKVEPVPGKKPAKKVTKDGVKRYFGIVHGEERVLFVRSELDLEDCDRSEEDGKLLMVPKALLRRRARITLRTDVEDMHCYVFAYGVLQLILERENLSSLQDDVLPLLLESQFREDADATAAANVAAMLSPATPESPTAQRLVRQLTRFDSVTSMDSLAAAQAPPQGCFALTVQTDAAAANFAVRADSLPT